MIDFDCDLIVIDCVHIVIVDYLTVWQMEIGIAGVKSGLQRLILSHSELEQSQWWRAGSSVNLTDDATTLSDIAKTTEIPPFIRDLIAYPLSVDVWCPASLTASERGVIWQHRYAFVDKPELLPIVLKASPISGSGASQSIVTYLRHCLSRLSSPLPPTVCLQLLEGSFAFPPVIFDRL